MDGSSRSTRADRALAATRAVFADALNHGDAKAVASVYADTARLLAPSAELIEGRDAIEAFWQTGLDAGVAHVELEAAEVHSQDRMAYEIGRYVLRLHPGADGTVVDRGRYVLVLEQAADGSWRRAVEMFNPETPRAGPRGADRSR